MATIKREKTLKANGVLSDIPSPNPDEHPLLVCPRCGVKLGYHGSPEGRFYTGPNYCGQCRHPLTEQARRWDARAALTTLTEMTEVAMEHAIKQVAAELDIPEKAARLLLIAWAKSQP